MSCCNTKTVGNLDPDEDTVPDITSLESRMTTAEKDITSLEGRMTTAETDITALETDVNGFPDALKNLTTAEINQLENIGSNTISNTTWGHVAGMNQSVAIGTNVSFDNVTCDIISCVQDVQTPAISESVNGEGILIDNGVRILDNTIRAATGGILAQLATTNKFNFYGLGGYIYSNTTAQSISNNVVTQVTMPNATGWNVNGTASGTANKLTAKLTGEYLVTAKLYWGSGGSAAGQIGLWLVYNDGSDYELKISEVYRGTTNGIWQHISWQLYMSANSTVGLRVWQNTGGTLTINGGSATTEMTLTLLSLI